MLVSTRVGKRRRKLKRRTPRVRRGTARQENFEKVPPQTFFKCKKTSHCGKNEVRFTKVQPYLAESKVRATKNKPCFTKKHFKSAVLMILKNNFHETYMICGKYGGCGAARGGRGAARREFFTDLPNTDTNLQFWSSVNECNQAIRLKKRKERERISK